MADNVGYTPGTGATVAADEIAGVLHQRVKITLGAGGVDGGDVAPDNPMPVAVSGAVAVTGPLTDAELRAAPVPISGSVDATGELLQCIEALRMAVQSLTRTVGLAMPDVAGRLRTNVEAAVITSGTITTVGTVSSITAGTITTVGTLTGQTNIGGNPATEVIPSFMRMAADSLRRNISVTS